MNPKSRRTQQGISMIEVLITLVVFSIGLLSVAGLQTISKKSNYDAIQRTQASILAMDMLERMRANPNVMSEYVAADGSEPTIKCNLTVCTSEQLADWDVWQWRRQLSGYAEWDSGQGGCGTTIGSVPSCAAGGLTAATGCIENLGGDFYQVVIAWRGVTAQDPPDPSDTTDPRNDSNCGDGAMDPLDTSLKAYDNRDDTASSDDNQMKRLLILKSYL